MKAISKKIAFLMLLLPITYFAHGGHVHTGTFWENAAHFFITNIWYVLPVFLLGIFLLRMVMKRKTVK